MTTITTPATRDDEVLAARVAWLASARDDDEARLIEAALLAATDNGPQPGDPDDDAAPADTDHREVAR